VSVDGPSGAPLVPGLGMRGNPLRALIVEEIRRRGPIPFSRYMEMCLYEPDLGYYSRAREQFGRAGDFYTSSDVHAVFGRLLARQFDEMWRLLDSPSRIDVIELGPGRGLFARDVLDWSAKRFPDFAQALCYSLIEQSEQLRSRLEECLSEHIATAKAQVFDSLEAASSQRERHSLAQHAARAPNRTPVLRSVGVEAEGAVLGSSPIASSESRSDGTNPPTFQDGALIIFANEFFDALPVEIIDHRGKVLIAEEQGRFVETFAPPSSTTSTATVFTRTKMNASRSRLPDSTGWIELPTSSSLGLASPSSSTMAIRAKSSLPGGIATP